MSRRGKVVGESKASSSIWLTHTKTSEDVRFAVHHILRNVYVVVSYLQLSMLNLRNVYCSRDDDKVIRST